MSAHDDAEAAMALAHRPAVVLPNCRGCDVTPSMETLLITDRGVVCGACGIDDPCGLFGPMRPSPGQG